MDLRQTRYWGKYLKSLGWETVIILKNAKARLRKLGILGSIIKIQRPPFLNKEFLEKVEDLAKKERALLIKIEPPLYSKEIATLEQFGYKKDQWPTIPTKTIILNLKDSFPNTYTKSARYDIRKAEDENTKVAFFKTSDKQAQENFYKLYQESAKGKFFISSFSGDFVPKCQALSPISFIALAYINKPELANNFLSGAFVSIVGDTAYYLHAGSLKEGKKIGTPYKLILEISKKLKGEKVKFLNLEGIYDPRYKNFSKGWEGFTHFKSQFGGIVVEFPPSFSKIKNPLLKIIDFLPLR